MPDPIRVTRAVRRCLTCDGSGREFGHHPPKGTNPDDPYGCPDCSDGWVDVPVVDDQCYACQGGSQAWRHPCGPRDCPRCGGSGRRLHNWATGWCVGDEILTESGDVVWIEEMDRYGTVYSGDMRADWDETSRTLVLSDPSHRPEPMRWKQ